MIRYIKAKLQARKNRRTAIKMLVCSGVLRHSDATVRYGMTEKVLSQFLKGYRERG